MEDDPLMSLALGADSASPNHPPRNAGLKIIAPAAADNNEEDPLMRLAEGSLKPDQANRKPLSPIPAATQRPSQQQQPRFGAIPLSRPSAPQQPSASSSFPSGPGHRIDAFRRQEPQHRPNSAAARGYQDQGQGSLIQRHSGLKVKNPLVSRSQLEARLAQCSVVPISQLRSRHLNAGLGPSWCTICAVGEVSVPKESSSGNTYTIWKLTDLDQTSVSMFLFGQAHHDLREEAPPGTLVAILSAKVRGDGGEFSLTVDKGDQVLVLGTTTEFGYCKAKQKNGQQCKIPVNASRCPYCSYHVSTEFKRLQPKRIELQGNALKSAFQNGMRRTLNWQPGQFRSADTTFKPSMPATAQWQLREAAAKAAGRGSAAGARYIKTVADPDVVRAAAAKIELAKLRRNKLSANAAPIPLQRTSTVVYSPPRAGQGKNKSNRGGGRGGSGFGAGALAAASGVKRKLLGADDQDAEGVMVDLEDDDIFGEAEGGSGGGGSGGGASVANNGAGLRSSAGDGDLARQRAVEIVKSMGGVAGKASGTGPRVPEFLAAPLRQQSQQRQQAQPVGGSRGSNPSAAVAGGRTAGTAAAAPAIIRQRQQQQRPQQHRESKPAAGPKAPVSSFAAAFGSVALEMEAQEGASGAQGASGSLYKDLVEEEDADRLGQMINLLEKRDEMATKMDSVKNMAVSAWMCITCEAITEYRPSTCAATHPASLQKTQATKRWWECGGCKRRFSTVGVRHPTGRCPKCDLPCMDFTAVSMLRPTKQLQHEVQQGGVASREQLVSRGTEQKWVNG